MQKGEKVLFCGVALAALGLFVNQPENVSAGSSLVNNQATAAKEKQGAINTKQIIPQQMIKLMKMTKSPLDGMT